MLTIACVMVCAAGGLAGGGARGVGVAAVAGPVVVRVAAFNVGRLRTEDLKDPENTRARRVAEVVQRVRPTVVLLDGVAYDDKPAGGGEEGTNGRRFAEAFLARAQATDLAPLKYRAYMGGTNSGRFSGLDLNRDGKAVNEYPTPGRAGAAAEARAYAEDCWGYGEFPGERGMVLLVDERVTIDAEHIRTFQMFPWDYMPGSFMPVVGEKDWYPPGVKEKVRLNSVSFWDVPVKLPNGAALHVLCVGATSVTPDGPEERNKRRNHDELRLVRDYVDNQPYLVDDRGLEGGMIMRKEGPQLGVTIPFVVVGTLGVDPKDGESFKSPVSGMLFKSRHINSAVTPESDVKVDRLDAWDTCAAGLRLDYVLPGKSLKVLDSGVWRAPPVVGGAGAFPSEHYPVWMQVEVAAPEAELEK